ncbi:hypothetical protein [Desulfoscipio gibsoniae]|uniref:Uncharacterized protein n=1 Tax=Desulfoscipio gibsoniae DSM 7213 TaxID=767817 RepID=R4KRS0_9FIRM|nr:hypothetical protein [Desulfoscipio gibsoniae]AGL02301.1 hypothetical protein Desgi_2903 [Desulfoscipio gibsoniae DSM 7213]
MYTGRCHQDAYHSIGINNIPPKTCDIVNDLLSISSVHPVREDIVNEILEKRNVDKAVIDDLLKRDMIVEFLYEGKKFYRKNIKK